MPKAVNFIGLLCIFSILSAIFGYTARGIRDSSKYEARFAELTAINQELQGEIGRLTELNKSITDRLSRANEIISGLYGQTDELGETVQRVIDNLQRLERKIKASSKNPQVGIYSGGGNYPH